MHITHEMGGSGGVFRDKYSLYIFHFYIFYYIGIVIFTTLLYARVYKRLFLTYTSIDKNKANII